MFRGIFRFIFTLVSLAFLFFLGAAVWIVYDGLNDQGEHADVAVVLGHAVRKDGVPGPLLRARLDRAIELYKKGEFPLIVVSGATQLGGYDEAASMAQYLQAHEVPAAAIIEDHEGASTASTARDMAGIMRERNLNTVMVVTHYYHITRTKLALKHEGIASIQQAHVGVVRKEDAFNLVREVIATDYYLAKFYLLPAVEKAKEKVKEEAHSVNN